MKHCNEEDKDNYKKILILNSNSKFLKNSLEVTYLPGNTIRIKFAKYFGFFCTGTSIFAQN